MVKYAYCNICKKEIDNPSRKPMETFHKVLWVLLIIASLGIGLIAYLIYIINKPKQYCPTCITKLKFSKEPFVSKEEDESIPRTPKEKVLKKAGKELPPKKKPDEKEEKVKEEKEEKIDDTFCPFCGEDISSSEKRCPYCGSKL